MKKLDKSRPYGEVFGPVGARYEQDHCYFNARGQECYLNGKAIEHVTAPTKKTPKAKKKADILPEEPAIKPKKPKAPKNVA